jgi:hypothetical protein
MSLILKRTIKDLVNDVLDVADDFMLKGDGENKCGRSLLEMLSMTARFCRAGEYDRAQQICELATNVTSIGNEYRGGFMDPFFAVGIVHYYMAATLIGLGSDDRAVSYFHNSSEHFKHIYPITASSVWLGAAELYEFREEFDKALWALQRAWNLLELRPGRPSELLRERIDSEYEQTKSGLMKKLESTPPRWARAGTISAPGKQGETYEFIESMDPINTHNILLFPVYNNLGAGSAIWLADTIDDELYVEIEEMRVKGTPYRIFNLRDSGKTIRFEREKLYGVAQVIGNSMNDLKSKNIDRCTISNYDFVLMSVPKDSKYSPQDGDIVAAALTDITGRRGVIKRYRKFRGEIWLRSESADPEEKDILFNETTDEIVSQVIAVLKPVTPKI